MSVIENKEEIAFGALATKTDTAPAALSKPTPSTLSKRTLTQSTRALDTDTPPVGDKQPTPGDDLLWGAQSVADFLGIKVDRVYYLIRTKRLPIAKLGRKTVVASKKKLQRAIADALVA